MEAKRDMKNPPYPADFMRLPQKEKKKKKKVKKFYRITRKQRRMIKVI